MIGQFSLCLTNLFTSITSALHRSSIDFFLTHLIKINKHAGYAALSWPRFNNSPGRRTTIINSNVSDETSQN